jgi:hypothetical protein
LTVHSGQRATLRVDAVSLKTGRRATIVQGNGAHLLPSGHITSLPDFRRDMLGWLDHYLGPVQTAPPVR